MDNNTLLAVAILAVVIVFIAVRFGSKINFKVKGPGVGLDVQAENRDSAPAPTAAPSQTPPAGVRIADATSRKGGILASSDSGVDIQRVDVQDDIIAESKSASKK